MQIKKAEKLPRKAMTLPKPGKSMAVRVHKLVTIVRVMTRRSLYRGTPVFDTWTRRLTRWVPGEGGADGKLDA